VQRHVNVPDIISEWSKAALKYETEAERTGTQLTEITVKYCNLRASMSSFHDYSNAEDLINSLCAVDLEYTTLLGKCPIPFIYTTVVLEEPSDEVYSDCECPLKPAYFLLLFPSFIEDCCRDLT
jgi:hypothetical protein